MSGWRPTSAVRRRCADARAPSGSGRFDSGVTMKTRGSSGMFYGWRVVAAAFVLAIFGWGLGFYGPPVYLHAVREARGWSLALVSAAVTVHFLFGAIVIANLPRLYRRFGVPAVTKTGAVSLACGITGWAVAQEPWQRFAATLLSGAGWVAMGAAAVNAIISPWFVRTRSGGTASAYNGGQDRRRGVFAAMGCCNRPPGIPRGSGGHRPRDDRDNLGPGRRVFRQVTATDGIAAGW